MDMYMYKNALMFLHPLGSFVVPLISQAGYNTSYIYTHIERREGRGGGWDDTMAICPFVCTLISDLAF